MTGLRRLIGVIVCVFLGLTAPAGADVVNDWNTIAINTIVAAGPVVPARNIEMAMVHIAIHDAVQAIQGRFETYSAGITRTSGSEIAAAAKAARDVLVDRFPAQAAATEATYQAYIGAHQIAPNDGGIAAGAQAAAAIIQARVGDGSYPVPAPIFLGGTGIGQWRPTQLTATTPPEPVPMVVSWLGTVRTFAVRDSSQFFASAPPRLTSSQYTREYNEVKDLGRNVGSTRTPEQTAIAMFFSDNAFLYWNRTLRPLADRYVRDVGDSARMFALTNTAAADAAMTSWQNKTRHNFWRPITAIQMGEFDGNRHTVGDPTWQPFLTTPNYPDHTSGANSITGVFSEMLRLFFGTDRVAFSVIGAGTNNVRDYLSFSAVADDVVDARVYQGIHFRFADKAGRRAGMRIARWVFKYFLRAHDSDDANLSLLAGEDDFYADDSAVDEAEGQDDTDAER